MTSSDFRGAGRTDRGGPVPSGRGSAVPAGRGGPVPAVRRGAAGLVLAAALGLVGCGSSAGTAAPSGSAQSSPVPSSPAAPSPAAPSSAAPSSASSVSAAGLRALAARYLAIARPANRQLDHAVDGFEDEQHDDVAKATADLRAEVVTERRFDRQLAAIHFPPAIAGTAAALIQANHARIRLTLQEARSASAAELRKFKRRHAAADAAVEVQVKALRKALGLPPPATS
jgi:hypothetical protein